MIVRFFQIYGTVVVMDFDGLSMKQVLGFTPSFSMKLLSFIQDAMPLRLKEVCEHLNRVSVEIYSLTPRAVQ